MSFIEPLPLEELTPELRRQIEGRCADGIGLGYSWTRLWDEYQRAHGDRRVLLARLTELERPDAEAIRAAPSLKDKKAVVIYFETDADRDECARALEKLVPRVRTENVP